jgi:hypothetical protein
VLGITDSSKTQEMMCGKKGSLDMVLKDY